MENHLFGNFCVAIFHNYKVCTKIFYFLENVAMSKKITFYFDFAFIFKTYNKNETKKFKYKNKNRTMGG